ncbi:MAG: hypothetical protein ACTTIT_05565 [Treponema sp.]
MNTLPLPPAMGTKLAPSNTANSTNRNETIKNAGKDWTEVVVEAITDTLIKKPFIDVDYRSMHSYIGLLTSINIPFESIKDKNITPNKMSFSLEMPCLMENGAMIIGLDYLQNIDDKNNLHAGLFRFDFDRRFFNNLSWFLGGGAGLRFEASNKDNFFAPKDSAPVSQTSLFAFKVQTGLMINLPYFITKIEVAYDNVLGLSVGAGVGICLETY